MPIQFNNVSVILKANVYFDGRVTSRTVVFPDGEKKTLGFMMPGTYTFGTNEAEIMEILAGDMTVMLPGSDAWQTINEGHSFQVPANSSFRLIIDKPTDYCCSYIKE